MTSIKTFPVCIALGVALLAGCTHTRDVGNDGTADYSFADLHEALEGRRVDITLHDERTMASTALRIRPDTTWFIDLLDGRIRRDATHDIYAVTRTQPGKGALEGAALGAAGGALFGLAAGFALTAFRDADEARTSLAQYISVPAGFFTILGIGTGTVLGARKGSRDRYVYPQLPLDVQAGASSASVQPPAPASTPVKQ